MSFISTIALVIVFVSGFFLVREGIKVKKILFDNRKHSGFFSKRIVSAYHSSLPLLIVLALFEIVLTLFLFFVGFPFLNPIFIKTFVILTIIYGFFTIPMTVIVFQSDKETLTKIINEDQIDMEAYNMQEWILCAYLIIFSIAVEVYISILQKNGPLIPLSLSGTMLETGGYIFVGLVVAGIMPILFLIASKINIDTKFNFNQKTKE